MNILFFIGGIILGLAICLIVILNTLESSYIGNILWTNDDDIFLAFDSKESMDALKSHKYVVVKSRKINDERDIFKNGKD